MRILWKLTVIALILGLTGMIAATATLGYGLWYFNKSLPNYDVLQEYRPPTVTRVHAGDGRLIAEYASQRRIYVPIDSIPHRVSNAFIAAEDKNFYDHFGIDVWAILRASLQNLQIVLQGGRPIGASTITQQVAKNFLLTNELSIARKAKEAILAVRIERALDKHQILDLYLNEIYLGRGAYGVAAAALTYFDKSLAELTIDEAAFLAALPKAPNNYNPWRDNARAKGRRDWVISRMAIEDFITQEQAEAAKAVPLTPIAAGQADTADARYFVEHVRRELADRYGLSQVNTGGLSVRTTLDTTLQRHAATALSSGLIAYDRRHGYRGALAQIEAEKLTQWWTVFETLKPSPLYADWQRAVVLQTQEDRALVGLETDTAESTPKTAIIPLRALRWARAYIDSFRRGGTITRITDVLKVGDVILTSPLNKAEQELFHEDLPIDLQQSSVVLYGLRQTPEVNGALVALDPFTGRILAMQGGFNYAESEFNRATQAKRQPGSSFKPFVYLAALEQGYTPASQILDAPFVLDQGPNKPKWKPANYSKEFYGLTPMRVGIEKSRNLMTVRLAQDIGMEKVADVAKRFDLHDDLPLNLSTSLGSHVTTLLDITRGYAQIVNGGSKVEITALDRVQDRLGNTLFLHDQRQCLACSLQDPNNIPVLHNPAPHVADAAQLYQITSMLRGVVLRGSGRRISTVDYPLAGKTGTSNDSFDTWFIGFSPDLVAGVFVGFDTPRSLGMHPGGYQETGSSVAAPIFRDFMAAANASRAKVPFRVPDNIEFVRINPTTGLRAREGEQAIEEAFLTGTAPAANTDESGANAEELQEITLF